MMMKSSMLFSALSAFCSLSLINAAALDVYAPTITSPTSTTIWTVGENVTVTWDTSDAPVHITNPNGEVHLRLNDLTNQTAVASGFSILDGNVTFTVPDIEPSLGYKVVLYGDSGDFSDSFTIMKPLF